MRSIISTIFAFAAYNYVALALPQSADPKPATAVLPIKARVGITNNWPGDLRVETVAQHNIDKKFPTSLQIPAGKTFPNPEAVVSANWAPVLSSFFLSFYTIGVDTVEVQLGKLGYKTQTLFAPANRKYELVTLFAPQKPLNFIADVDTHLHILSGPGNIPPIANRLLEDEIPSLNRHLGWFKPKFNVTKGVTLSIDHAPDSVTCEYAVLEPSDDGLYRFNAVIGITGSLTGTFDIPAIKLNGRYDVAVTNLRILLKVTLDMGAGGLPKPTLTSFQLNVDKLKLSSPTSKAITALWPFVAGITGIPGSLSGYLNTELNKKVIELANKALEKVTGPKQPTTLMKVIAEAAGITF